MATTSIILTRIQYVLATAKDRLGTVGQIVLCARVSARSGRAWAKLVVYACLREHLALGDRAHIIAGGHARRVRADAQNEH
jgi:hypothetical protein